MLRVLAETYFAEGGMELQFNVVSRETLLAARRDPQKYRNLVVRVSGFSAYFVTLDPVLQDEIINRTEHQGI
jgi:formate C-acetyltransferase